MVAPERFGLAFVVRRRLGRLRALARLKPFETESDEGRSSERYRRIILTTASGFGVRIISALVSFVTVPVTLSYLGVVRYGLWSLVSTAVTWFSLLGLNITGGLRNALTEAHGKDDKRAALEYLSTATFVLFGIATVVGLGLWLSAPFTNWSRILGVGDQVPRPVVQVAVITGLLLFLINLPAAIPSTVFSAFQKQYVPNLLSLAAALVTLPVLLLAIHFRVSLSGLLVAISAGPLVASGFSYVYLVTRSERWISISIGSCSVVAFKRIARTSVPMIFYQIGSLLVNETQQIVISRRANLTTVADYSLLMRVVVTIGAVANLSTTAFLPALREATERGDWQWAKKALWRMVGVRTAIAGGFGMLFLVFGNRLMHLWLRRSDVHFGFFEWFIVVIGLTLSTWTTAFIDYMTALDDIWRQIVLVFVNGVVAVVLSMILTPRYGLAGVLVATYAVAICFWSWIVPLMVRGPGHIRR